MGRRSPTEPSPSATAIRSSRREFTRMSWSPRCGSGSAGNWKYGARLMIARLPLAAVVVVALALQSRVATAAEMLMLTPIHDCRSDPPGSKIDASCRIPPAQWPEESTARVLRMSRPERLGLARVMSTLAAVRDKDGNSQAVVPVDEAPAAGTRPRLVTIGA